MLIDLQKGEIVVPKALQTYSADFEGGEAQIIQFILRYADQKLDIAQVAEQIRDQKVVVKYQL